MVIFRENTEDIYAGLEVEEGTPEAKRMIQMLHDEFGWDIRPDSGVGIKPISDHGLQAPDPRRHQLRGRARPQVGDPRAQGQHPEVHRGRLPQLGLRADPGRVRRRGRRLGRLRRQARRQDPREGQHRRHHPAAGPDPARTSSTSSPPRTSTATTSPTPWPPRSAGSASRPGPTSTTSPATASSRRPTAPPPSTPARTRSTRARCSCPA